MRRPCETLYKQSGVFLSVVFLQIEDRLAILLLCIHCPWQFPSHKVQDQVEPRPEIIFRPKLLPSMSTQRCIHRRSAEFRLFSWWKNLSVHNMLPRQAKVNQVIALLGRICRLTERKIGCLDISMNVAMLMEGLNAIQHLQSQCNTFRQWNTMQALCRET